MADPNCRYRGCEDLEDIAIRSDMSSLLDVDELSTQELFDKSASEEYPPPAVQEFNTKGEVIKPTSTQSLVRTSVELIKQNGELRNEVDRLRKLYRQKYRDNKRSERSLEYIKKTTNIDQFREFVFDLIGDKRNPQCERSGFLHNEVLRLRASQTASGRRARKVTEERATWISFALQRSYIKSSEIPDLK